MASEPRQLQAAIDALEAQRPLPGDAVVEMAIGPLRARHTALAEAASVTAAAATDGPVQTLKQVSTFLSKTATPLVQRARGRSH